MPTYSNQRPVRVTDDSEKYAEDHVTYFINNVSLGIVESLSLEDKERFFKLVTDHESLITELYGNAVTNSKVFLPVLARKGINNSLVNEYRAWLEKQ